MAQTLPPVKVVRKYIDDDFDVFTPVLVLRWEDSPGASERIWELPEGMCVVGPPPRHLGIRIRPQEGEAYAVRLVWDNTLLTWPVLSRLEVLGSCLAPLLAALNVDLWSLLEQPRHQIRLRPAAA